MVQSQFTLFKLWKPQCVQCRTKNSMHIDSNIICGNNTISNIHHIKFLGLIIHITLSWGICMERIVNKLSCVCYIVGSVKPYMSHSSLIITLFSTPLCHMVLYFGETHLVVRKSKTKKKEQFEL
jgi:hypothetical protein